MTLCAKYNIIYAYIDHFYNINDVMTEGCYNIFKYKHFHSFRSIVIKLENLNDHLIFDMDMVV